MISNKESTRKMDKWNKNRKSRILARKMTRIMDQNQGTNGILPIGVANLL